MSYGSSVNHLLHEEGFAALASISSELKYRIFKLRPKLHLLIHVVTFGSLYFSIVNGV